MIVLQIKSTTSSSVSKLKELKFEVQVTSSISSGNFPDMFFVANTSCRTPSLLVTKEYSANASASSRSLFAKDNVYPSFFVTTSPLFEKVLSDHVRYHVYWLSGILLSPYVAFFYKITLSQMVCSITIEPSSFIFLICNLIIIQ